MPVCILSAKIKTGTDDFNGGRAMRICFAVLALLMLNLGGYAMIETLSLENLVRGADTIVLADIDKVKPVGVSEEKLEVIANLVRVHEPLKGGVAVGEALKIKTFRGIEDSVIFTEGARVLLFLKKNDNHFTIFNGPQGCWKMEKDGTFSGMGHGTTLEQVKEAIAAPAAPASSSYVPVMF